MIWAHTSIPPSLSLLHSPTALKAAPALRRAVSDRNSHGASDPEAERCETAVGTTSVTPNFPKSSFMRVFSLDAAAIVRGRQRWSRPLARGRAFCSLSRKGPAHPAGSGAEPLCAQGGGHRPSVPGRRPAPGSPRPRPTANSPSWSCSHPPLEFPPIRHRNMAPGLTTDSLAGQLARGAPTTSLRGRDGSVRSRGRDKARRDPRGRTGRGLTIAPRRGGAGAPSTRRGSRCPRGRAAGAACPGCRAAPSAGTATAGAAGRPSPQRPAPSRSSAWLRPTGSAPTPASRLSAQREGRAAPRPALPRPGSPSAQPGPRVSQRMGESHGHAATSSPRPLSLPRRRGSGFSPPRPRPRGRCGRDRVPRPPCPRAARWDTGGAEGVASHSLHLDTLAQPGRQGRKEILRTCPKISRRAAGGQLHPSAGPCSEKGSVEDEFSF